jgi:DDE domain/Arm DNA-binding domain
LRLLREENSEWQSVVVRSRRYLNNIIEQDHRAIKRRCAPMLALKSFRTAAVTLAGVELAHRIRKGQFSFGRGSPRRFSSLKHLWALALAHHDLATDRNVVSVAKINHQCTRTHAYRFARKYKTLSLGTYPMITIAWARSRHEFARNLLANGVDPAALKATIGKQAFAAMLREWETARGELSSLPQSVAEAIRVLRA